MKKRIRKKWKWIKKNDNILYLINDIKEKKKKKICKNNEMYIYI